MINSTKTIEVWYKNLGKIPIMKKGQIPQPEDIIASTSDNIDDEVNKEIAEKEIEKLKESKGLVAIDKKYISPKFIQDVEKDRNLLEEIQENWFGEGADAIKDLDPKLDKVKNEIDHLLTERSDRKIVIFSAYADTVEYLARELLKRGLTRVLKYTASDAGKNMKKTVRTNFDAGLSEKDQKDDYDVLITTDALSEGYNLHRAGVIINYDIPYNPTRVIQRIGRINRINKKVFDRLYIYNFFPTETGESEIKIHQISTLKMRLINSVVGSDTKTLTDDEKLESFFKDEYRKAEDENETVSWDAGYREDYDVAKNEKDILDAALQIKPRSRVVREGRENSAVVAFGKKGEHSIFVLKEGDDPEVVIAGNALKHFKAKKEEQGKMADKQYDEVFKLVRDCLFEKHKLPPIAGRRADSIKVIKLIEKKIPEAKDYCQDLIQIIKKYDGINDGDLKSVAQLSLKNFKEAFEQLKGIVPMHQIGAINARAMQLEGECETIVLSEDIRI